MSAILDNAKATGDLFTLEDQLNIAKQVGGEGPQNEVDVLEGRVNQLLRQKRLTQVRYCRSTVVVVVVAR